MNAGNDPKGTAFEVAFAQRNDLKPGEGEGWLFGDAAQKTGFNRMKAEEKLKRRPAVANFTKRVMYEMKYGTSELKPSQLKADAKSIKQGWHVVYIFSQERPESDIEKVREVRIKVVIVWNAEAIEELP